jgi:diaminohydroxyphosphoribosylaminopyrimidine deaminase/5-amino-6-(5-phosphoribosylamino)uracil reductase
VPNFTPTDETFIRRALKLASDTIGLASPNPQVGCVLVRDGKVIAEGAHLYDLYDHAEIAALKSCPEDPRGATAYVTLEPCSHHGRTGPCADALIAAGIARCVVATADPNPAVSGRGLAKLRAAGIEITLGPLEAEARALNNAFAFSIAHRRPLVTLKAALSVDGQLAPPPALRSETAPFFLTSPEARAEVQQLRHASDAILTGIGTVLADNPLLTDRTNLPRRRPLIRVLLDSALRIPLDANLLHPVAQDLWIFCAPEASPDRLQALTDAGALVTPVPYHARGLDLAAILAHLHHAKLLSVLLETGATLNGAFLRHQLVDRAILYYSEAELGPGAIPFARDFPSSIALSSFALEESLQQLEKRPVGPDVCVSGLLHDPWSNLREFPPEIS